MEKMIVSIFLILAHTSGLVVSKSIFLLAGQSNMSGRGGVNASKWDGIVPPQCTPSPRILRLNAALQWEEAREPLHSGIDPNGALGVGPGMPFSNTLLLISNLGENIGLVPCAQGGTSIRHWSRGSRLYNRLLTRAAAALKDGGTLRGLLWYQGENDAVARRAAHQYKAKFQRFVYDVRSDLSSPSLPIIEVALASGGYPALRRVVRKAQLKSASEVGNVICVEGQGLPLELDGLHLTTPSQVKLGKIMANAILPYL